MRFQDWSLSKKFAAALVILLMPVLILLSFLVSEKDSLSTFTRQEIAGVAYLRALQHGFVASLPNADANAATAAAVAVEQAETNDKGALSLTQQSRDIASALRAGSTSDAAARLSEAITAASDNSNITLDPDADAYFIGDMLVN